MKNSILAFATLASVALPGCSTTHPSCGYSVGKTRDSVGQVFDVSAMTGSHSCLHDAHESPAFTPKTPPANLTPALEKKWQEMTGDKKITVVNKSSY